MTPKLNVTGPLLAFAFALSSGAILAYAWIAQSVRAADAGRFFGWLTVGGAAAIAFALVLAARARKATLDDSRSAQ